MQNRRRFLSLLGVGAASVPLAAKAVADAEMAKSMGLRASNGLGNAGMGLSWATGGMPAKSESASDQTYVPYEKRLIQAADYINTIGIPKHVELSLRDEASNVGSLDPDIACKKSWSMSVKIMTQRQRNYDKCLKRIQAAGWRERSRATLRDILGFEWPW